MYRFIASVFIVIATLTAHLAHAKPYKGAEMYSYQSYLYGRYEMRMQVANASGVLSTFFTYKNGSEIANTFWEEIDIEIFGKNNATQWQSNIILGTQRPTINTEQLHTASGSLADGYHTYVIEWTPDYVAWFLDGAEVRRITGTSTVTSLTNAQSVRFNVWSSTDINWVGPFDDTKLPVYQFVSYLDYKAYNATTKTFEGGWRDDFNSFDTSRWGKADWTFDVNRVDFSQDNVLVKDGVLVLAFTREGATGFTGAVPVDGGSSSSSSAISSTASSSSSIAVSASSSIESSASSSSAVVESSSSSAISVAASSAIATSSKASSKSSGGGSGGGSIGWLMIFFTAGLLFIRRR